MHHDENERLESELIELCESFSDHPLISFKHVAEHRSLGHLLSFT